MHIGNDVVVFVKNIIGIFNIENIKNVKKIIDNTKEKIEVIKIFDFDKDYEKKSLLLVKQDGIIKIYISNISSKTLASRIEK